MYRYRTIKKMCSYAHSITLSLSIYCAIYCHQITHKLRCVNMHCFFVQLSDIEVKYCQEQVLKFTNGVCVDDKSSVIWTSSYLLQ